MFDISLLSNYQRQTLVTVILHVVGMRSLDGNTNVRALNGRKANNGIDKILLHTDQANQRVTVINFATSFSHRDIRLWNNMSREANVGEDKVQHVIHELESLSEETLVSRLLPFVWTIMNMTCLKVKIISQHAGETTSVQILWRSAVNGRDHITQVLRSSLLPFEHGSVLMLSFHPAMAPVLTPVWAQESTRILNSLSPVGLQYEQVLDIQQILGPLPRLYDTLNLTGSAFLSPRPPSEKDSQSQVPCVVCFVETPLDQVVFIDECGHCACMNCAVMCAKYHITHPTATTSNMPCPAERCGAFLRKEEIYVLLEADDLDTLTFNEVKVTLGDRLVECPKCSTTFERDEMALQAGLHTVETHFATQEGMLVDGVVLDKVLATDRAKYRFRCSTCNTEFCSSCNSTPYHVGLTCRDPSEPQVTCRFCRTVISYHITQNVCKPVFPSVCKDEECLTKARIACNKTLPCGHRCGGVVNEVCLPCLEPQCVERRPTGPKQTNDDFCLICYVETLDASPCVQLQCGHVFHFTCLEARFQKRWPGARITFQFMNCLICGVPGECAALSRVLEPLKHLKSEVERLTIDRITAENKSEVLQNPDSKYYNNPLLYSYDYYCYYYCSKCTKPFFGGMRHCGIEDEMPLDARAIGGRENIICGGCVSTTGSCPKHGTQFIEYKCKYCCSLAVWYCWGTTHFCEICHNPPRKTPRYVCEGPGKCPFGGNHPPNGNECSLGCGMCRVAMLSSSN